MALICFWDLKVGRKAKTHEQFVADMAVKHPDITVLGEYVTTNKKLQVQHRCGHRWSVKPKSLLQGTGCPKCTMEARKKTHEQFVADLYKVNPAVTVLGEYVYSSAKLQVQHRCGHRWSVKPNSLLEGKGCPKCAMEARKKTHEQFVAELAEVSPDITVLGEYVYANAKLQVQHRCGHRWSVKASDLLHGYGCPKCNVGGKSKTHDQFVAELAEVSPDITVLGEYVYANAKLQVKHKCGHQWSVKPNSLIQGHGCPKCAKSGYDSSKRAYFYSYYFDDYLGFGITNVPKQRSKAHKTTFKKLSIEATLMQTFSGDGKAIQDLETYLKRTLPIVNTGVEGFKTEAILWEDRELLFKACEDFQRDQLDIDLTLWYDTPILE